MFTNNPLGHDYNEPMVDRLLGKAYQTIKEVHESLPDIAQAIAVGEDSKKVTASVDKLTATLKGFKEGTGLFIGHDLGEVGVEDSKDTYIGDNFLSELTKSGTNVKTVGDNVSTINRLAEHINELKAIAEALTSLLTVKDSLNEVDTINQNIEKIKTVANNSSNINSVYDCLDNINALAGSINDFPELIEHGEDIATVAQHISYVVTLGSNIVGFHNRIVSLETATDSLDKRLTAAEQLNTSQSESLTDHERRIGNIETTSDVGQIAVRVQAIEDKNVEQDTALDNETRARVAKEKLLDAKDTELTNALADEQQAREQKDTSLETKNTEQDGRLDAIETKNTEQDGRLDAIETKNTEQDNKIKTNTTNINANANSISGLNSQVTEINSHISKLVTLDTAQEISASKTFVGDDLIGLNLRSSVIDLDNPASISLNGKNIFFSDKKNKNIGSVYSGVYNGTGFDGVFTRLQVRNEKSTGENNTPYLEVQARNSGLNAAYGPSNISHSYLKEIATVDWVYQRANINDIVAWKIANGLCISVVQLITVAGQMSTYTYPIPYVATPVTVGGVLGITSPNANTVPQFYCSITDITPTSFKCGFISNGFLEQGFISVISIGDPA